MTPHDRKYFQCDTEEINWPDFMSIILGLNFNFGIIRDRILGVFSAGLRLYIVQELPDTIEAGRKRYKYKVSLLINIYPHSHFIRRRLKILHYLLLTLIYAVLAFFAFKVLESYGLVAVGVDVYTRGNNAFIQHNKTWVLESY